MSKLSEATMASTAASAGLSRISDEVERGCRHAGHSFEMHFENRVAASSCVPAFLETTRRSRNGRRERSSRGKGVHLSLENDIYNIEMFLSAVGKESCSQTQTRQSVAPLHPLRSLKNKKNFNSECFLSSWKVVNTCNCLCQKLAAQRKFSALESPDPTKHGNNSICRSCDEYISQMTDI